MILEGAKIQECPIQMNMCDCNLFEITVVLHLINTVDISATTFTQDHITKFREHLRDVFDAEESNINPDWITFLSRANCAIFDPIIIYHINDVYFWALQNLRDENMLSVLSNWMQFHRKVVLAENKARSDMLSSMCGLPSP